MVDRQPTKERLSCSAIQGVHGPTADIYGWAASKKSEIQELTVDIIIIVIVLLLLFGGGGGLYWGMGGGWGMGPIGLIIAVLVIAYLLNGYRGRRRR